MSIRKFSAVAAAAWMALSVVCAPAHADDAQLTLTTENYPPFNMQDESELRIIGISTDIVREMMMRAGIGYAIKFLPWQRAYGMALENPATCVFSTTITDERLPLFKWVGPLTRNDWVFFGRADTAIEISSLDQARAYTVGGYKGDAVAIYLESEGFTLDLASHDHVNPNKLEAGRFELWASGNYLGPYLAGQAGVDIVPLYTFRETLMGLACNLSVDDEVIAQLNNILETMRQDGALEAIAATYQDRTSNEVDTASQ
jgi:polar amino acid transport system substrate-binding protein